MKPLFYALVCFLIAGCAGFNPNGSRNFAIDTYNPLPNEIQIAESRARQYWMQNGARLGPGYLAVDASLIFPDEVQYLWPKLINSETTASVFARGSQDFSLSDVVLYGVVIFHPRTGHLVSRQGYVVADLPERGSIARFNNYYARYIVSAG